jgi:hypothetical protein
MPISDLAEAKRRARQAWLQAKRVNAVPEPLVDRWYSDFLLASRDVPDPVKFTMADRTIQLFALLADRHSWLEHEAAPPARSPHPPLRPGRMPRWSRS